MVINWVVQKVIWLLFGLMLPSRDEAEEVKKEDRCVRVFLKH